MLSDGSTNSLYGHDRLAVRGQAWSVGDALGRVRQTLDGTGGVLAATGYDPWGGPQYGLLVPFGVTGELHAQERVYLRARWYAPGNGTLTSRDPFAGFPTQPYSLHPYQYAYSNPVNWIDPTGRFRCRDARTMLGTISAAGPGAPLSPLYADTSAYAILCETAYQAADALLASSTNAVATLVALFAHADLPGGYRGAAARLRQSDRTAAAERLEFVLDWMADIAGTTFKHETGQDGFNEQFLDPWPEQSGNQMNHFMQAVGLAYAPDSYVNHWAVQGFVHPEAREDPTYTALRLIVGHEKVGDAGEASMPGRKQLSTARIIPAQYHAATQQDVDLFLGAVRADERGQSALRDCLLRDIIPGLPDDLRGQTAAYPDRVGNSLQDLRLSVKGWSFGQQIKAGSVTTLPEATVWLTTHLR